MKADKTLTILVVVVVVALGICVAQYCVNNYTDWDDPIQGEDSISTPQTLVDSFVVGEYMEYQISVGGIITYKKLTVTEIGTDGPTVEEYTKLSYQGESHDMRDSNVWDSDWVNSFTSAGDTVINTIDGKQKVCMWTNDGITLSIRSSISTHWKILITL